MDQDEGKRLEVLQNNEDITCLTIVMKGEDHTLGNSLRFIIMKNPDVKFCGYAVPHPSEHKINLRIQTYGASAADVFKKSLEDLKKLCDVVTDKFKKAKRDYEEGNNEPMHADD